MRTSPYTIIIVIELPKRGEKEREQRLEQDETTVLGYPKKSWMGGTFKAPKVCQGKSIPEPIPLHGGELHSFSWLKQTPHCKEHLRCVLDFASIPSHPFGFPTATRKETDKENFG